MLNSSKNMTEKTFYRPLGQEIEVFESAYQNHLPLLLKGPTGCGKSRFVEAMAERKGRPLITVACNDETSSTDLLGRYLVQGGDTVWQDGPVTRAVRQGAILYLDEIAEARQDVVTVLHPLTDHRRCLFIDRRNETLVATGEFMMIISYNPGYQQSLKELKPSTKQRFVSLAFTYPSIEIETEIIQKESGIDKAVAEKLAKLAVKIRTLEELGIAETASTRLLVGAAKLIKQGLPERIACDVAIIQPLTDDPDIVGALRDIVSLIL